MASGKTAPCKPHPPLAVQPMFGAMITQTMVSGCELGIFQRLARGPMSARQLARAIEVKPRGLTMLLDALVASGQLVKQDDVYALPPSTQAMLAVPGVDAATHYGDVAQHARGLLAGWAQLSEVIRSGQPIGGGSSSQANIELQFQGLARSLFPGNYLQARSLFQKTKSRFGRGSVEILDVAAGGAAWSTPFIEGNPAAHATASDFPAVLQVARHFARALGVADRYTYQAGDIHHDAFRSSHYDLALLGHICHAEGPARTRKLFRKVARALKPDGVMIVAEFLPDEQRCGTDGGAFALLFALNMLVRTEEGGTFTVSEYEAWARAAGFGRSELIDVSGPSPVLLFGK